MDSLDSAWRIYGKYNFTVFLICNFSSGTSLNLHKLNAHVMMVSVNKPLLLLLWVKLGLEANLKVE